MSLCRSFSVGLAAAICAGSASAQIAYVYIPNGTQTYVYKVNSTGKLTGLDKSPFAAAGSVVGSNGSYFLTIDQSSILHSYPINANGGLQAEASEINTLNNTGAACGNPTAGGRTNATAALDNTGSDVYVQMYLASEQQCTALQSYKVNNKGVFAFTGASIYAQGGPTMAGTGLPPTLTGNNNYAYSYLQVQGTCVSGIRAFSRDNTGTLNAVSFTETDPTPPSGYTEFEPYSAIAADQNNHLAIVLAPSNGCFTATGTAVLASYTVNQGNITSTNSFAEMPQLKAKPAAVAAPRVAASPSAESQPGFKIDPTGSFLASAGSTGIDFYNFNGAKPITPLASIDLGASAYIYQIGWDTYGHLYALDVANNLMHVYLVTASKVKEVAGSPSTVAPSFGYFAVHSN